MFKIPFTAFSGRGRELEEGSGRKKYHYTEEEKNKVKKLEEIKWEKRDMRLNKKKKLRQEGRNA